MNYNSKRFRPITTSKNSQVSEEVIFEYHQIDSILTCTYRGGLIKEGHLIGLVDDEGKIEMRYHQINHLDELMTGTCTSIPEQLENGKILLHETWKWTSGDLSEGSSILEEI